MPEVEMLELERELEENSLRLEQLEIRICKCEKGLSVWQIILGTLIALAILFGAAIVHYAV